MRLYLSSFGLGDSPAHLLLLLRGARRAAVILNAKDHATPEGRAESLEGELRSLHRLGLEAVELDLREYFGRADRTSFALGRFDLVWIRGGNTFVLRRALRQSGADEAIKKMLSQDRIVYGGFSAAAAVLPSSLRGL